MAEDANGISLTQAEVDAAKLLVASAAAKQVAAEKKAAVEKTEPFGSASLVCGIMALIFSISPFGVWNVLGITFGNISKNRRKNGRATAGLVCSWIAVVLSVLKFFFILMYVINSGAGAFSSLGEFFSRYR